MPDAFLSYSHNDKPMMVRVKDYLQAHGIKVWADEKIETGAPSWLRAIENAIKSSRGVIVLLSPTANESKWVENELSFASNWGKRIFPVLVKGDYRSSVPFQLATTQYADLTADFDTNIANLLAAFQAYLQVSEGTLAEDLRRELQAALKRAFTFYQNAFAGPVSSDWPVEPLSNIVKFLPVSRLEGLALGSFPVYGATGVIYFVDSYQFDGNYILIGNVGANLFTRKHSAAFSVKGKFSCNGNAFVVQCRDVILPEYLISFLSVTDLNELVTGSTIPHLTKTAIGNIPVQVSPLLDQQKYIASRIQQDWATIDYVRTTLLHGIDRLNPGLMEVLKNTFTDVF